MRMVESSRKESKSKSDELQKKQVEYEEVFQSRRILEEKEKDYIQRLERYQDMEKQIGSV